MFVFENDVKIYGIQTPTFGNAGRNEFENDVKIYGIQTETKTSEITVCLRMM